MAGNTPYQRSYASSSSPGSVRTRLGANTPAISRRQLPYNQYSYSAPRSQGYQGLPRQMMQTGPREPRGPSPTLPRYGQPPFAQYPPTSNYVRKGIQSVSYGRAVQSDGEPTQQRPSKMINRREFHPDLRRRRKNPVPAESLDTGPEPSAAPVGTSGQIPKTVGPAHRNTGKQKVDAGARRPVTLESESTVASQHISTGDEDDDSLSDAPATGLSAAVKEGVEKAFVKGLLEGQGAVFSGIEKELRRSCTIFGINVALPQNKTLEKVIKSVQDDLRELFDRSGAEVANHPGVKYTRQWLERRIQEARASSHEEQDIRSDRISASSQERDEAIASRASEVIDGNEAEAQTPRGSGVPRSGRRSKGKSLDYTILGVHGEYSHEGKKCLSYDCSDGHRRIISPTMVEERTRQARAAPPHAVPVPAPGTPSHTAKLTPKRKYSPEGGNIADLKKKKAAHAPEQTNPNSAAHANAALLFGSTKSKMQQPVQRIQTTVTGSDGKDSRSRDEADEYFDWERYESNRNSAAKQAASPADLEQCVARESMEKSPASMEEGVPDYESKRIKELLRLDKTMPMSVMKEFMHPRAGSKYSAVREAVRRGDHGDQSHLLFQQDCLETAKQEYEMHANEGVESVKQNQSVANAVPHYNRIQTHEDEGPSAAERRGAPEERPAAEEQQAEQEKQAGGDKRKGTAGEEDTAGGMVPSGCQNSVAAFIGCDNSLVGESPSWIGKEFPDLLDSYPDVYGGGQDIADYTNPDMTKTQPLFTDMMADLAWDNGELYSQLDRK
ncbi:uncharacterized protein MAM_04192 [Metarhizium album ARSEF 1941]|uniref:Uncharacterized protein n=1 Tax=Metarhizium album (strain ARSEF 1941) TaxID=1081103 RepID=A0A0B2WUQ9_METAS|nr:uncharacterized protein MAM_04192 [Metarhizium album ARSEF 1941]KHN97803.1 hypothetical protein MAM_04192 [Metarhizium album ARSEF 1941]